MRLTFDSRQHAGHIIETSDEASAKVEARGSKSLTLLRRPLERIEAGPERFVHNGLELLLTTPGDLVQAARDVFLEGQRGSHTLML